MTVPFDGAPLHAQRSHYERLEELGYTDLWSAESVAADGLTPLLLGSIWTPYINNGVSCPALSFVSFPGFDVAEAIEALALS